MISVLNWKPYNKGSMKGFFDLRYHGLTVKGCRLMSSNKGLWFCFPQVKGEQDGEVKYFDQMFLTSLERDHVRRLIVLDLQKQGHIESSKQEKQPRPQQQTHKTPEGEDLSQHYTGGSQDDIPF